MEERLAQIEERVARLEGQAQAQPSANTVEEIIRQQIDLLVDVQHRALIRGNHDTVLQIAIEIVKMADLVKHSVLY